MRFISIFTHEPTDRPPAERGREDIVEHAKPFLAVVGQGTCEIYRLYETPG